MGEKAEVKSIEEKVAAVDSWVGKIALEGKVDEIDRVLLRQVLESLGAHFELSVAASYSLSRFGNPYRRAGMYEVWGERRVNEYESWLSVYLSDYETRTGRPLPVLEDSDIKTSGGLKFFSDLTVFAAGLMSFEDYQRITERRAEKGRIWQARNPEDEYKLSKYSSFPPELPLTAWEKIKSGAQNPVQG